MHDTTLALVTLIPPAYASTYRPRRYLRTIFLHQVVDHEAAAVETVIAVIYSLKD